MIVLVLMASLAACGAPARTTSSSTTPTHPPLPTTRDYSATVRVGGQPRGYEVHLPPNLTWNAPRPLVLALHGLGQDAAQMAAMTGFNTLADQKDFIVVYPQSEGSGWGMDDTSYVAALLAHVATTLPVDPARIDAAGFSEGGFFAEQLACQLPREPLAAMVAVGATLAQVQTLLCSPAHPVSVLLMDGTADQYVPFDGGVRFGYELDSAPDTAATWAHIDACGQPKAQTLSPVTAGALQVQTTVYRDCASETSVVLDAIQGGAHIWPSSGDAGATASGLDATTIAWDFFVSHPRQ